MEPTRSELELDNAIEELNGMYKDLSNTLRRHSRTGVGGQLAVARTYSVASESSFEDDDYDIPRPVSGYMNEDIRASFSNSAASNRARLDVGESEKFFSAGSPPPKSPTSSEYSSGIGTLSNKKVLGTRLEIDFPGPPDIEVPPPIPDPPSDSDYDEVASIASEESDTFIYSVPNKNTNSPNKDSADEDYSEIPESNRLAVKVIDVRAAIAGDEDGPDYDEVYSEPSSQRDSAVIVTENEGSPGETKIVVQMKPVKKSSPTRKDIEIPNFEMEETSFINPQIKAETTPVPTLPPKLEPTGTEESKSENEKSEITKAAAVQQISDDVISSSHPAETDSNAPKENAASSDSLNRGKGNGESPTADKKSMDVEAQRESPKGKKDGPECPCECRVAVPLMTVAVVICIILLMFLVIAFVYIGVQNDEYLEQVKDNPGVYEPSGSGDGL